MDLWTALRGGRRMGTMRAEVGAQRPAAFAPKHPPLPTTPQGQVTSDSQEFLFWTVPGKACSAWRRVDASGRRKNGGSAPKPPGYLFQNHVGLEKVGVSRTDWRIARRGAPIPLTGKPFTNLWPFCPLPGSGSLLFSLLAERSDRPDSLSPRTPTSQSASATPRSPPPVRRFVSEVSRTQS